MVSKVNRSEVRVNKHRRLRSRLSGTPERPRLAVFHSNNHMYAQVIDDVAAKKALDNGINEVVFDRGGYIYQGKVKALADAAREAGLQF